MEVNLAYNICQDITIHTAKPICFQVLTFNQFHFVLTKNLLGMAYSAMRLTEAENGGLR